MICNEIQPIPSDWAKRPIIRQYNGNNELVVRTYGQTQEELLKDHIEGKCGAFCGYCYDEAMKSVETKCDGHTCPVCGGHLEGDGYTSPVCCENAEAPLDVEPDSGPYYCDIGPHCFDETAAGEPYTGPVYSDDVIANLTSINPSDMGWINSGEHFASTEVKDGIYPDPDGEDVPF